MATARDFNTISPSAGALLMMKALTDIPFAKETAAMVGDLESFARSAREKKSRVMLGRTIHFENRYKTIDKALSAIDPVQVLELSSGFSCRGLDMVLHKDVTYVDTDLPEFIANKKKLVDSLVADQQLQLHGRLYVEPLNAMDVPQFEEVTRLFDGRPVTVVNEGLLVYLNTEEKRQLCATIHRLLKQHGGYWVTGDAYIRRDMSRLLDQPQEAFDEQLTKFLEEHRIDDNKFDSYEEANSFFESCHFKVLRRIDIDYASLSSLKLINREIEEEKVREWMQGRETWVLEPV
ncbi:class I SAM-dependent methyltransferase [Paraflavitalea sp. CAU 1676]|uniref:class I SAM-dependent methyltransferase n=1 Tax=Paraflavitalea sp. CAU 1676 TaxID=3032598 RepID=UPI0023DA0484|nr:class I SAM-dependent methyltransferase [Paraflavitalea sp. CAU 1676]MDF2187805.1 class I SAM-dependent methyltransferase [Paraflavitalea sp. CAU 1676]